MYGLAVFASAATISSRRASTAASSPATDSSRCPAREALLSSRWMSALRLERADVTPPSTPRRGTHPSAPPAATSARLTCGDAADSRTAIAAVPTSTASTGITGAPCASAHVPCSRSAARSGVPIPPPAHTSTFVRRRSSW